MFLQRRVSTPIGVVFLVVAAVLIFGGVFIYKFIVLSGESIIVSPPITWNLVIGNNKNI